MKRVRSLLELDYDAESEKKRDPCVDVMWAVFGAFNKWFCIGDTPEFYDNISGKISFWKL